MKPNDYILHRRKQSTNQIDSPSSSSSQRYADSQRASPFFRFLQRLRNSSGKGGNLFLPSSSFILSDVSLPLIAEAKTTKKIVLRLQCQGCKHVSQHPIKARVTIQNYYQYRHVDKPGWKLGWTWAKNETILSMAGAFATKQGNCSSFKFQTPPHSCEKSPVIADLMPDALSENKPDGCCHGGLLAAWAINPSKSFSSFEMTIGNLVTNPNVQAPINLTLMAPGPGYTCDLIEDTDPSVYSDIGGKRQLQAYRTWKSTCTYSSFVANQAPICCVSLSTFYNPKITSCPTCSCGCREADKNTVSCIREGYSEPESDSFDNNDIVQCTDHMCPVRIHWHIMTNYVTHWKVKLTISNYNYERNYSNWNVVIQHPGFSQSTTAYSFNSTMLPSFGFSGTFSLQYCSNGQDSDISPPSPHVPGFWPSSLLGYIESPLWERTSPSSLLPSVRTKDSPLRESISPEEYYNDELLYAEEDKVGAVSTQILLRKDLDSFTLRNGWALPRRIYFNGEDCQMPLPDTFPMLPNVSSSLKPTNPVFLLCIYLTFKRLFT
ncbi:hypothetical protein GOBAR_DD00301 [Gossypium barbadense]|nr:hypothetical protein GOBAR_DD00301 [Gossypium barbadense]